MGNFIKYLLEEKASKEDFGDLGNDPKGKLHELLVGMHLNGGKHMETFRDENKKTPKQVHDEIAEKLGGVNSPQYKNFSERAKKAAEDIKKQLSLKDEDIAHVRWTSKHGDLESATSIPATQTQDGSDVLITDRNGRHHGVSLKVSNDNKPITLSNGGVEDTYGGSKIHEDNKNKIKQQYPELQHISNPEQRKEWLRNNPQAKTNINGRNVATLQNIAKHMSEQISNMTPEQKVEHIRKTLKAYSTPMQAHGHNHIRHFTGGGHDPVLETSHPGEDHEHFLNQPDRIKVRHAGTSIYFEHHGEDGRVTPFAMQTAKFSSQSDPLSSLVVVGKEVKRKKDKAPPVAPILQTEKPPAPKPAVKNKKVQITPTSNEQKRAKQSASSTIGGQSFYSPSEIGRHADDGGRAVDESKKSSGLGFKKLLEMIGR